MTGVADVENQTTAAQSGKESAKLAAVAGKLGPAFRPTSEYQPQPKPAKTIKQTAKGSMITEAVGASR